MAVEKQKCRVCGREYEPCRTATRTPGVFHWQEVACSPECGATYLQRVLASRAPASPPKRAGHRKEPERDTAIKAEMVEPDVPVDE